MKTAVKGRPAYSRRPPVPKILCVDDDPDVSGAIQRRLSNYAVDVVRAFHGMQGFAEATSLKPDVIVMDLAMPRGDGATILECLRRNQETAGIPVIVLTGIRDRQLRHKLLRLGANRFLYKPIRLEDLLHELRRFIDLRERTIEIT